MSYKRKVSTIYSKLIQCMDNNDLSSFLSILNKHPNLDIEYEDKRNGHTLLTYACAYGLFDFIKILIENKDADVNHCNSHTHNSPLHCSTSSNNGVILKLLISNDADVYAMNNDGYNAMEYALFMNHMICYHEFKKMIGISYSKIKNERNYVKKQKMKKHWASKSSSNLSTFSLPSLSFKSLSQKRVFDDSDIICDPPPIIKSVSEGIHRKHSYAKRDMIKKHHRIVNPHYEMKYKNYIKKEKPKEKPKQKLSTSTSTNCRSCAVLQNEVDAISNERDILQQKLTNSIHAFVLEKELVRKLETELRILKQKLHTIYNNNQDWKEDQDQDENEDEDEFELDDDYKSATCAPGAYHRQLSVNLEQSVTAVIAIHDEEEKSQSYMMEEEYVVMEGKEGVKMTQCKNINRKVRDPIHIANVFSFDGGIDDDLLINLHSNTPTPLSPNYDEKENDAELEETMQKSERWKVFESSQFAQLFSVLQYRTYCYCEREKRTSLILKEMISNDKMYLMKMEELHSAAINEELNILKPIFHIETLSNFLKNLIVTENDLDSLFKQHQECHDIIYKSTELHLRNTGILYKKEPVFNWYISDYQQMWIYQELFYNNFERFLLNISSALHESNIYCCHKNDFDDKNRYKYKITPSTSMASKYKRTKQNINQYYIDKFGENFNKKDTVFCSPKNASRSFFKVFYDFDGAVSHLTDFLRASFVFDNFEDLYNALFVINDFCKKYSKNDGILKYKNSFLFNSKLNNGWRQIILNVPLCCDQLIPLICEIQLHFSLFWQFKDDTHRMYEISRLFKIRDHKTGKTRNLAMQCAKQFYSEDSSN